MKTKLTTLLVMVSVWCFADESCITNFSEQGSCFGIYYASTSSPFRVVTIDSDCLEIPVDNITNMVNYLAEKGVICEVKVHVWGACDVMLTCNPPRVQRKCSMCGKVETKLETWK
jgi:hypothetical protein